jgi:hypothetical protein
MPWWHRLCTRKSPTNFFFHPLTRKSQQSVAILGSALSIIVGLLIHFVMLGWPKGDEHTNWGMKMNKLAFLTRRGCVSLFTSITIWTLLYGIFWFIGLLIVFSSRQVSASNPKDRSVFAPARFSYRSSEYDPCRA